MPRGNIIVPAGCGFLCEIPDPVTAYYYPPEARVPWEFVYVCFDGPAALAMVHELNARCGPIYPLSPESEIIGRLLAWRHMAGLTIHITPQEGANLVMTLLTTLLAAHESGQIDAGNQQVLRHRSWCSSACMKS